VKKHTVLSLLGAAMALGGVGGGVDRPKHELQGCGKEKRKERKRERQNRKKARKK
jgi:hypothetical protein